MLTAEELDRKLELDVKQALRAEREYRNKGIGGIVAILMVVAVVLLTYFRC
jgi:hypothetical protein